MPNILLTRIDNRLVHGQVGVTWVNHLGANLIVVANDEVAEDEVQQDLMEMVVPEAIGVRFFSIQTTADIIHEASEDQNIFLVSKTPQDVLRLVEGGVPIDKVNIGNMHYSEGKTQIYSTVSIDDADKEAFRKLKEHGVKLEVRRVPDERPDDIYKFL
ncbi:MULTISPECIES: PTS N-acetylgalactosamine transporter subunit IIB [Bacillaceae]|uniref:PTS N-acetylgalactosamine transporter subunit IIB n=1 Tax=Bacillaceae TaxID=186817 RepID=UPI0013D82E45|nr:MULTISPECIES: PTS N-acetylgalactosamine transporter subunit IIB [Bacillaceae]MCC3645893.1 PTS N-acetylgalactosamine transporter subunit IIB [Cytobacillus oceanisediminis]MCS0652495.1 PTS N-acetylgalactosamine transporter subunit IIB [Cytobacillus firmus]MCU1804308.1 PTS N-acetylgalactosamine transporter subunit IIB [Cytobacillus firmus]WHY36084.1 PTS N-acetylgalactosamine transporter subunit IIB [Cytobacillus firmus]